MLLIRSISLLTLLCLSLTPSSGWTATTQTTDALNLRVGQDNSYKVTAVVPSGAFIDIVKCGVEWCYVTWGTNQGYVEGQFLLDHVTVKVPQLSDFKPAAAASPGVCESQWGLADLNGDGVLDAAEIAHYNSVIRLKGQTVLGSADRLSERGFDEECNARGARE
jgi:uncharacterized protein YraI